MHGKSYCELYEEINGEQERLAKEEALQAKIESAAILIKAQRLKASAIHTQLRRKEQRARLRLRFLARVISG